MATTATFLHVVPRFKVFRSSPPFSTVLVCAMMHRPSLAGLGASAGNSRKSLAGAGRPSLAGGIKRASNIGGEDLRRSRGISMGGRRSSMAPGAGGRKPNDPRNISDKKFKDAAIKKLIQYLAEHGYDRAISTQILTAPSAKEFVYILSFLLKNAIPNFKFGAKYEDDVPVVLKALGYPYTISKGALSAVGTPHTWPHLLAALSWLVDLLKYAEAAFDGEENGDFDADDDNKVFFDYLQKAYQLFLSGEDDLSPLDEQLAFVFESKNSSLISEINGLQSANADLATKIKGFKGVPNEETGELETPLQKERARNQLLVDDTAKVEKFVMTLRAHLTKVNGKLEEDRQYSRELEKELAMVNAQIESYKTTTAKQELTPSDVQRMNAERDRLESELARLKARKDELNKQLWEEETAISRGIDLLEGKIQQANNCALRLQLIPAEARNAGGVSHHLELRKHLLQTEPHSLLNIDPNAVIKPSLSQLKARFVCELATTQESMLEAEEAERNRDEEKQAREEELQELKMAMQRLEKEEKLVRDEHARQLDEINREKELLQGQILAARSNGGSSLLHSQNELTALQKEYDGFMQLSKQELEKMHSHLVSELDILTVHKTGMEQQLAELNEHLAKMLSDLQADS